MTEPKKLTDDQIENLALSKLAKSFKVSQTEIEKLANPFITELVTVHQVPRTVIKLSSVYEVIVQGELPLKLYLTVLAPAIKALADANAKRGGIRRSLNRVLETLKKATMKNPDHVPVLKKGSTTDYTVPTSIADLSLFNFMKYGEECKEVMVDGKKQLKPFNIFIDTLNKWCAWIAGNQASQFAKRLATTEDVASDPSKKDGIYVNPHIWLALSHWLFSAKLMVIRIEELFKHFNRDENSGEVITTEPAESESSD